jgi:pSer/pThr/pTyr-binding forkhead associated (FHA) protein
MFQLVIEDDEGRKTVVPLVRSEISIGRIDGNTIRLTERNVSRRHAKIVREGDRCFVEDSSRYGTRKNGRKIAGRTTFDEGDVVVIGDYRLQVRRGDASVTSATTDPAGTKPVEAPTNALDLDSAKTTALPRAAIAAAVAKASVPSTAPSEAVASASAPLTPAAALDGVESRQLPTSEQSRLRCLSAPYLGSEFIVTTEIFVMGRSTDSDAIIDHQAVSKRHARVITTDGAWKIEDLGSANGLRINGVQTRSASLKARDIIDFGGLKFEFLPPGVPAGALPAAAFEDAEPVASRPAWILPAAGLIAAAAIAAVVIAFSRRAPEPTPENVVVASPTEALDPAAAAIADGQRLMNGARWDEAIAAFDRVPADSDRAEEAGTLKARSEAERDSERIYSEIVSHVEGGRFSDALRRINDVPTSSYYRTRITDENLERRALNGLVDERLASSQTAQEAGDMAQARTLITEIQPLAPDDTRITNRLAQLDAIAEGRSPEPVAVPVVAVAAPDAGTAAREEERPSSRDSGSSREEEEEEAPAAGGDVDDLKAQARRAAVQRDYRTAIRLLEDALALRPGDSSINLMLYTNYRAVGANSRAADAIRRYLRQEPDDPRRSEFETFLAEHGE